MLTVSVECSDSDPVATAPGSDALFVNQMKLNFSFKREPMWIWVLSLGPAVIGLLVVLVIVLLR